MTKKIPSGRVATYGQIAAMCGSPRAARQVGWAMHAIDDSLDKRNIPWQRVINRHGMISTTCLEHPAEEQAFRLQREGVQVTKKDGNYFINLSKFLWRQGKNR